MPSVPPALRLTIDLDALVANWRWLAARSGGAACGAAVKADGYGVGAARVAAALARAGCRTLFVATWAEAEALLPLPHGMTLRVLHGVREAELPFAVAAAGAAMPVLNTAAQVARWRAAAPDRPCDLMVDTGMNRLGLAPGELAAAQGLKVETVHSHLACADEPDHVLNARQLAAFRALDAGGAQRSLANSAGICLGPDYAFDLTRPGIALYGGVQHPDMAGAIRPVVGIEAQIVQLRDVPAGESIGYGATASGPLRIAVLNLGYADGYLRAFSGGAGEAIVGGERRAVVGRVSMDLTAIDATGTGLREGDWVAIDFDLPRAAARSGLSQYELLTGLGARYQRAYR
ncbi:MAG: alanine racemase [Alphaproteobacteria bacterium]|nr:alanine racemase [Alphaproteobacteria bacterium]